MSPYLHDSPATLANSPAGPLNDITNKHNRSAQDEREPYKRDFSPEYEPSPTARIRKVNAEKEPPRWDDTPTKAAPQRPPVEKKATTDTFLNLDGGSDNDDSPQRSRTQGERQTGQVAARIEQTKRRSPTDGCFNGAKV
jgi:hypothetical protein